MCVEVIVSNFSGVFLRHSVHGRIKNSITIFHRTRVMSHIIWNISFESDNLGTYVTYGEKGAGGKKKLGTTGPPLVLAAVSVRQMIIVDVFLSYRRRSSRHQTPAFTRLWERYHLANWRLTAQNSYQPVNACNQRYKNQNVDNINVSVSTAATLGT